MLTVHLPRNTVEIVPCAIATWPCLPSRRAPSTTSTDRPAEMGGHGASRAAGPHWATVHPSGLKPALLLPSSSSSCPPTRSSSCPLLFPPLPVSILPVRTVRTVAQWAVARLRAWSNYSPEVPTKAGPRPTSVLGSSSRRNSIKRSWNPVRRRSTPTPLSTMSIALRAYSQSEFTWPAITPFPARAVDV
jgi:hypothetical protein